MPVVTEARLNSREKARTYRERMRASGFRPVQFWVPDTRTAAFRAEAHRQSRAVARSAQEHEDQAFIDAMSDRGSA
ncbi:MAG: antitoxin MazE family protein [Acidobacteria bacterium]|nr:antitoxin MazE family protein [Acidobacteriota bacterium]